MLDLLAIFIPAVLVSVFLKFYWKDDITNTEAGISLGVNLVVSLLLVGVLSLVQQMKMYDTEVWSGVVTGKERNTVSCEHISCNCYTTCSGTGKTRSCTRHCSACHDWDVDWDVYTTLGTYDIDRIDDQGLKEPSRWTIVQKGEYVTDTRSYKNPLLADEKTLFVELPEMKQAGYYYPKYPEIYDYWKIQRVSGITGPLRNELNSLLNERLKTVGPKKQLNIILVGTTVTDPKYFNGLMADWRGGKKNDVIMVYGLDSSNAINWFRSNSYVMGMGNKELHNRLVSNASGGILTPQHVSSQLDLIEKHFNRLSTDEIKFKAMAVDTPLWLVVLLTLINLVTSILLGKYMKDNDISLNGGTLTTNRSKSKSHSRRGF
jgi:hypothetical protein